MHVFFLSNKVIFLTILLVSVAISVKDKKQSFAKFKF